MPGPSSYSSPKSAEATGPGVLGVISQLPSSRNHAFLASIFHPPRPASPDFTSLVGLCLLDHFLLFFLAFFGPPPPHLGGCTNAASRAPCPSAAEAGGVALKFLVTVAVGVCLHELQLFQSVRSPFSGGLHSWSLAGYLTWLTITVQDSDITQMMEMIAAFQAQRRHAYGWRFEIDLGLTAASLKFADAATL